MVFIASYTAIMYTTYWTCISNKESIQSNYLNGCSLHIAHMVVVVTSAFSLIGTDVEHSSCFILMFHLARNGLKVFGTGVITSLLMLLLILLPILTSLVKLSLCCVI